MTRFAAIGLLVVVGLTTSVSAKDSLGVYANWAAFRDPGTPRCYAIAKPLSSRATRDFEPFASVATWPRRDIRNQVHLRLSRELADEPEITLTVGGKSFDLVGGGGDAWAQDARMDAAIVAALRSADRMSVRARAASGARFTDRYELAGVATAMDAAVVGCSSLE